MLHLKGVLLSIHAVFLLCSQRWCGSPSAAAFELALGMHSAFLLLDLLLLGLQASQTNDPIHLRFAT